MCARLNMLIFVRLRGYTWLVGKFALRTDKKLMQQQRPRTRALKALKAAQKQKKPVSQQNYKRVKQLKVGVSAVAKRLRRGRVCSALGQARLVYPWRLRQRLHSIHLIALQRNISAGVLGVCYVCAE